MTFLWWLIALFLLFMSFVLGNMVGCMAFLLLAKKRCPEAIKMFGDAVRYDIDIKAKCDIQE